MHKTYALTPIGAVTSFLTTACAGLTARQWHSNDRSLLRATAQAYRSVSSSSASKRSRN